MTKTEIIAAIKQSAIKSAGVPPGMKRFEAETGVSMHVWRGKYWLRWSQALAEAGLSPNRASEAYEDEFILGKLAELTRLHKHFPTYAEMVLAKTTDARFPRAEAVHRLGSKPARIELLRSFAARNPSYADILGVLPSSTSIEDGDAEVEEPSDGVDVEGFVYMMKLGKHYKIGHTTAVPRRHREISLKLPEKPSIVHYIRTDDPEGIERYWHGRFGEFRANGEWFSLTQKEVRTFKRRRTM